MTNEDLQSIGEMLRQARESQALSLEEVEAQTRIRAKFLQALEDGDIDVLPSTTHAKGFLRNYAQFLRLDVDDLVARLVEATGTGIRPVTQLTAQPAHSPLPETPQPSPPDGEPVLAVPYDETAVETDVDQAESILPDELEPSAPPAPPRRPTYVTPAQRVGPGAPVGLRLPPADAEPSVAPEGTMQPRREAPGPAAQGSSVARLLRSNLFTLVILVIGAAAVIWWATSRLSAISGEQLMPPTQSSDFLEQFAESVTLEPSPTFRPTSTPQPEAGPEILDRVVLSITVTQRTWTLIEVDGATVYEGPNNPGEVLRYEGREEIFIRTGNAAALEVVYNGQDLGPLGERGKVVERFFTVGSVITPTTTPTLTPTNTGVPTPTPRFTPTPEP